MTMRARALLGWALVAVTAPATAVSAQEIATEAPVLDLRITPEEVRVGDVVEATLELTVPEGFGEATFPNWQRHWGSAEIRSIGDIEADGQSPNRRRYSQTLSLVSFRPGAVLLDSQQVKLAGPEGSVELETPKTAGFEVVSILPEQEEAHDPKPPTPPQELALGERFWWTFALLGALVAALAGLLVARQRRSASAGTQQFDPWAAFERALARLADSRDAETIFTGLSLELRRLVGRSFGFPAAESTTTEIKRRMRRAGIPPEVGSRIIELLIEADGVKFAKRTPEKGRTEHCLRQARSTGRDIRAFVEPTEEDQPDERAA